MKTNRCTIHILKQTDYEDIKKLYVNNQVREFLGGVVTEERYNECFVKMTNTKKMNYIG